MDISIPCSTNHNIPLEVLQDASWCGGFQKAIITFGIGDGGAKGKFSGLPVYGHKDYLQIKTGETWYCALEPNSSKNYFAIPILKINESTAYALSHEFRRDLAETMLLQFPEQARTLLEESTRRDDQQMDPSEHDIDRSSDEPNIDGASERNPAEIVRTDTFEKSNTICRSGPNRLTSDLFVEQHYNVCISRDRSTMMIQANESGKIMCCDNTIEIDGLDELMPSLERMIMKPKVSKNTGTIWVSIKQESPKVDHDDGGNETSASPDVL